MVTIQQPNLTVAIAAFFYAFTRKSGAFLNQVNLAELNQAAQRPLRSLR